MRHLLSTTALALGVLMTIACGSDRHGAMTAPSTVLASPPAASETTFVLQPSEATATPVTVTSLVAGTACPTLRFTISTYTFAVGAATQYSGGACTNIQAGSKITFNATRENQTSTMFHVTQLSFAATSTPPSPTPTPSPTPAPNPPTPPPSSTNPPAVPVQTEVTITAIGTGACPELQFFVGAYALNVSTATQYSGGSCGDLKAGARLAIAGTKKETEGFVRVSTVAFKTPQSPTPSPTTPPGPPSPPVEGEGVITAIGDAAACPSRDFYVGAYLVKLDATTQYAGGGCSSLQVGRKVGVRGTVLAERIVAASLITMAPDSPPPPRPQAEGEGVVGALVGGTSCPSLQFRIGEYTVTVDAATAFSGGGCTGIAPGRLLHVIATMTGERQALASQVIFKN